MINLNRGFENLQEIYKMYILCLQKNKNNF
nr:MAG TPA: hypothetical protein [Caudoviricetes sp.]